MELENTRKAVQFDVLSKNICKQKTKKYMLCAINGMEVSSALEPNFF